MNDALKQLRESTGAGILDIQRALQKAGGDKAKAVEILREQGALKMNQKAERAAREGIVESYIHPGGRIGVLLEINCETDFVARTEDFKRLAKDLCLHIAGANPLYVSPDEVPNEIVEKEIWKDQAKGKSEKIAKKILAGQMAKFYEEVCLLDQPFVKNPEVKVRQLIADAVAKMGENIQIRRYSRFVLGN